eukprot:COSAG04_NODE_506_length_13333_cov_155.913405_1_plen_73_part_10
MLEPGAKPPMSSALPSATAGPVDWGQHGGRARMSAAPPGASREQEAAEPEAAALRRRLRAVEAQLAAARADGE